MGQVDLAQIMGYIKKVKLGQVTNGEVGPGWVVHKNINIVWENNSFPIDKYFFYNKDFHKNAIISKCTLAHYCGHVVTRM